MQRKQSLDYSLQVTGLILAESGGLGLAQDRVRSIATRNIPA